MGTCQSVVRRADKSIREYQLVDHLYDINEVGVATDAARSLLGSPVTRSEDPAIQLSAL